MPIICIHSKNWNLAISFLKKSDLDFGVIFHNPSMFWYEKLLEQLSSFKRKAATKGWPSPDEHRDEKMMSGSCLVGRKGNPISHAKVGICVFTTRYLLSDATICKLSDVLRIYRVKFLKYGTNLIIGAQMTDLRTR